MKYSIDDLEQDIDSVIDELRELRKNKGHDYSEGDDTLENLRPCGSYGVVVRIGDKFHRLKSLLKKEDIACKDEKIEDTMKDLINYALYLLIMHRHSTPTTATTVKTATSEPPRHYSVPALGADRKM